AAHLKQGALNGKTLADGSAADYKRLRPFMEAVAEGNEDHALTILQSWLEGYPQIFWHPYVRAQLEHLYEFPFYFSLYDHVSPSAARIADERRARWLAQLVEAFAAGLTDWNVHITKPAAKRGQAPSLFPILGDTTQPPGFVPDEHVAALTF